MGKAGAIKLHIGILVILAVAVGSTCRNLAVKEGFHEGEEISVECRDFVTGKWEPGPLCHENGKNLSFFLGINSYRYCGLEVKDQGYLNSLAGVLTLEKPWQCRVPMNKNHTQFVPFTLQLWGHVDKFEHLRVNHRMNFVFHIYGGSIIAATAYPVFDRLQLVKVGSIASLHGSVVWFHHHTFQSESSLAVAAPLESAEEWLLAAAAAAVSSLVTLLAAAVLYQRRLKPAIIRKCLKKE